MFRYRNFYQLHVSGKQGTIMATLKYTNFPESNSGQLKKSFTSGEYIPSWLWSPSSLSRKLRSFTSSSLSLFGTDDVPGMNPRSVIPSSFSRSFMPWSGSWTLENNVLTKHWCLMLQQMWERTFRQTSHVRIVNEIQKIQSSDWLKWCCVLWQ